MMVRPARAPIWEMMTSLCLGSTTKMWCSMDSTVARPLSTSWRIGSSR